MLLKFIICFVAGIGAGLGTGFAGMSAAAVISPMLITFLDMPAYDAVGTSVFIMTFTALTGSASHFAIKGIPDFWCLLFVFPPHCYGQESQQNLQIKQP